MKFELLYLLKNKRLICLALALLILCMTAVYFTPSAEQTTADGYDETISSFLTLSENRLKKAQASGESSFSRNYYKKLTEVYGELYSIKLPVSKSTVTGWGNFLSCAYVFPLLLICCVIFCVAMFNREKQNGTFAVLYASKRGRGTFVCTKFAVCLFVCFVLSALFSLAGLLGALLKSGLSGGTQYIQSLANFIYCPFALKVWQAAVLGTLMSALAASAVSCFAGVTVYITESALFSYSLAALFSVASFFANKAQYLNFNAFFKNCNLFAAATPDVYLGQYIALNIFSFPFLVVLANIVVSLLSLGILFAAFFFLHIRRVSLKIKLPSIKKDKMSKRQKSKKSRAGSLYGFEVLKIFSSRLTVLLLAALTLFRVGECIYRVYDGVLIDELIYAEYYRKWTGEPTEQKSEELLAEKSRFTEAINNYDEFRMSMANHTEYKGDAEKTIDEFGYANTHIPALERFEDRYNYAQATEGKVFYESGWLSIFNKGIDPVLCIAVLYLCLFLTSYERMHKTVSTVYISKHGHKRVYVKRFLSLLTVCIILTLFYELCRALPTVINYGLPNGAYKLIYLKEYDNYPSNLSLTYYAVIIYTVKVFATAAVCALSVGAERLFVKKGTK